MNTIKQSYQAARYYKKTMFIFFLFFSLSLALLMTLSQLTMAQIMTRQTIIERWNYLELITPNISSNITQAIVEHSDKVIYTYRTWFIISLSCIFILSFIYSIFFTALRKNQIASLFFMGIKKINVFKYLIIELLLPMIASFIVTAIVLFLFHESFMTSTIAWNQQLNTDQLSEQVTVKLEDVDNIPTTLTPEQQESDQLLVPFNHLSFFDINYNTHNFKYVFEPLLLTFLILVMIVLSSSFLGFMVLSRLYSKRGGF